MEQGQLSISAIKLSKKFCKNLKRSLWYGYQDIVGSILGRTTKTELRKDEFWALSDLNFSLKKGECLGLIGHNGAGKSTLLKMLNGIIKPDDGSIEINGRLGALIELGAGFNPILTGRENIFNNGAVLGFTKKEIESKLEEIISFSELEEFIDSPVQNYSSGMKVRLGFAVAVSLKPDVLLIDEVLAVGDTGFVLKCYNKIDSLLPDTAVVFVSHNMPQVARICTSILLLDKGKIQYYGENVSKGIDLYYQRFDLKRGLNFQSSEAQIEEIYLGESKVDNYQHRYLSDLKVHMKVKIDKKYPHPDVVLIFHDKEFRPIATCLNQEMSYAYDNDGNSKELVVSIPKINLSKGKYAISLNLLAKRGYKPLISHQGILAFSIEGDILKWTPILFDSNWETK